MDIYDSIARWNLWGSWHIPASFEREQTNEIGKYIDSEEIIALIGPRRAGKSTILYQIMAKLCENGTDEKAILHINFEEPGLSPELQLSLLDNLYNIYRSRVYPKGKAYIFLDEIQNVPEWEKWVRARNDLEDIKIFITGSSSALLSGELATVLSGRNFCFNIYPLNFREVLKFKNISLPKKPFTSMPSAEVSYALNEYLKWGGFPRVVLAKDDAERERILTRYLDEILFKDIIQRHQIRNVMALKNIAIHLLTNTSTLCSLKRIAGIFQISPDLAQTYINYLSEAFIIKTLPFYSLKSAERVRNPMKVHAIDLGLRKIVTLSPSPDNSKILETQVHNKLLQDNKYTMYYWKGDGEIDILTQQGNTITNLFQVAYAGLDKDKVIEREIGGLQKAAKKFTEAQIQLITWSIDSIKEINNPKIKTLPLWSFLLADS